MNLNPVYRFRLECLTSMEQAWQRLLSVTKEQTPLQFFIPESGWGLKDDNLRYLGKLDKYRFVLTKRTFANWHGLPYHQHQYLVISGNIEFGGSGCVVNLTIRPILPILFAWFGLLALFFGLLWGVLTTSTSEPFVFVGMAFATLMFWVLTIRYRKAVREERQFLESIFESRQEAQKPRMAPAIG